MMCWLKQKDELFSVGSVEVCALGAPSKWCRSSDDVCYVLKWFMFEDYDSCFEDSPFHRVIVSLQLYSVLKPKAAWQAFIMRLAFKIWLCHKDWSRWFDEGHCVCGVAQPPQPECCGTAVTVTFNSLSINHLQHCYNTIWYHNWVRSAFKEDICRQTLIKLF